MARHLLIIILSIFFSFEIQASIFCPHDKSMLCSDDIYDFDKLGRPVLMGNSWGKQARFIDNDQRNSCNVGYIYRRWYVDENNDQQWQQTELDCIQSLYFSYEEYPVTITFPSNKIYSCKEDIVNEKPTWVTGPCNVLGLSHKDDVFEVSDDACYKILRHFKVIDWCDADGDGIMNIWEHTQIIKVIDEDAPRLSGCQYQEFGTGSDCKASVVLTNSGFDDTTCGDQQLTWIVQVDLWANGDIDMEFSYAKTGDFYLKPTANNEEIEVKLPEKVGIGSHKVHWSVRDECGNIKSCHTLFRVLDKKPPTPYLHTFLTAAFDATSMPLMVPARIFNVGSFDNCSPTKHLIYSFSPDVTDTVRVVDCNNAGFQFYTLYVTDQAGNQEFVDVFLLAFDNGSCNATGTLSASLTESNGAGIPTGRIVAKRPGMEIEAIKNEHSEYTFDKMALYSDYQISADLMGLNPEPNRVNVMDLVWLQEYIFGKRTLENFQWVAADVNGDTKLNTADLFALKKRILQGFENSASNSPYQIIFEAKNLDKASLLSLKSQGQILQYDGHFDFTAVLKGDITTANDILTENRNQAVLEKVYTENGVEWIATKDMEIKGLQWAFGNVDETIALESDVYAGNQFEMFTSSEGITRVISTQPVSLKKGDVIWKAFGTECHQLITLEESGWVTDNDVFEYFTIRHKKEITSGHIIYPNPVAFDLFYVDPAFEVKRIVNISGEKIVFTQNERQVNIDQNLPSGIYFVNLAGKDGSERVEKLLKM